MRGEENRHKYERENDVSGMFRGPYKGKPTEYAGVTFRSELESEWAFHFDCRRTAWVYEPCRIKLASRRSYTPDFAIPVHHLLIEVKPTEPAMDEFFRAGWASDILGRGIWFLCGHPGSAAVFAPRLFGNGRYGFEAAAPDSLPFAT